MPPDEATSQVDQARVLTLLNEYIFGARRLAESDGFTPYEFYAALIQAIYIEEQAAAERGLADKFNKIREEARAQAAIKPLAKK